MDISLVRLGARPTFRLIGLLFGSVLATALGLVPSVALAELLAFPGAEGPGKFATGGRGGDVYIVSNLNDSGAGSLRDGIQTANGPRTIVFGVSGNINLDRGLAVTKNNITIAGQTAPEGGITITGYKTVIRAENIIFQHVNLRLGDLHYTPTTTQDALSVVLSNNVIVDHVSASWSTDEVLSTTYSDNVTVQWSFITEALTRPAGNNENHGFGSIMAGGNISYHHNLFAHNYSRNARASQDLDDSVGSHDFVNNVIYNPGSRYGYSADEEFDLNLVANFGIDGQDTTANSLFHGGGSDNRIYQRDNYLDRDTDGVLDLTPAGGSVLSGSYTTRAERIGVPEISNETDAPTAYNQVLSHAGASRWRGSVDKRVVKSVFDQTGRQINSQNEVGGYPTIPSNTIALDSDGIPDSWKVANGFDPDNESLGYQFASDGYTYLEKYLHSLSAPLFPSGKPKASVAFSTAYGEGADSTVSENGGISTGNGHAPILNSRWSTDSGSPRNQYTLLRFDLSEIVAGTVEDASLELTAYRQMGTETLRVYGLLPETDSVVWGENTVEFASAPGLEFDGDLDTRGRVEDDWFTLGEIKAGMVAEGSTILLDNLNLATYLNQLQYRDVADSTVTFLLERITDTGILSQFASKEATHLESTAEGTVPAGTYAPTLSLTAELIPAADFNLDGTVDSFDLSLWEQNYGTPSGATRLQGDADGDGDVDGKDFLMWQVSLRKFTSIESIPEPNCFVLGISAVLLVGLRANKTPSAA